MILKTEKKRKHLRPHALPEYGPGGAIIQRELDPLSQKELELERARREIAALKRQKAQLAEERFQEGYAQGRLKGREETLQEMGQKLDTLSGMIAALRENEQSFLKEAEQFVVRLALNVVEKIIGDEALAEVKLKKAVLQNALTEAVNYFAENGKYLLHVHPQSAAFAAEIKEELEQQLDKRITLNICEDPSLKSGECLIESDYGILDARFASQYEQIRKQLFGG